VPQEQKSVILKTNYDVFYGLTADGLKGLENYLIVLGKDKVYSVNFDSSGSESLFMYNVLRQVFGNFKIISDKNRIISDYTIFFSGLKLKLSYPGIVTKIFPVGSRFIERNVSVYNAYTIYPSTNPDSVLFSGSFGKNNSDKFDIDDREQVESGEYDFLSSPLPAQKFWSRVMIPSLVIGLSALTIVLFFLVRSK